MISILNFTLRYLRFNFVWPKKGTELNPGKWYYIKFTLMTVITMVVLIGSILHLIVAVKNKSYRSISEDLVVIIAEVGVYYFQLIFVFYVKEIAQVYLDLSDFEKFGKPDNFESRNKRLIFLSRCYIGFIDFAIVLFYSSAYLVRPACEKYNEIQEWKDVCGLMVPSWMPFNIRDYPYKQIFRVWQIFSLFFSLKGAAVISFAIMETMEHLVLRIEHMKTILNQAIDTEDDCERQKLLAKSIQYHDYIFDIGKRVDKYYTFCLFLHVLLSGALFGCIGYKTQEEFALNAVSLFVGWLMSLNIVCASGQNLIDAAESVGDIAYNSKWYDREVSFQKIIVIIINRAQRPIVVHAGPFTFVSHVTILTILKTAYSYMTLLNATTKD